MASSVCCWCAASFRRWREGEEIVAACVLAQLHGVAVERVGLVHLADGDFLDAVLHAEQELREISARPAFDGDFWRDGHLRGGFDNDSAAAVVPASFPDLLRH